MVSIAESVNPAASQLKAALDAGMNTVSSSQTITFTKYVRLVLPIDGFVFWVRSDMVSDSAKYGAAIFGLTQFGQGESVTVPAETVTATGSLHYAVEKNQNEDESISINYVIFNAQEQIQDFEEIGQNEIYIGEFLGFRFSFSHLATAYQQAGLWHYRGDAIYPAMESQIIDDIGQFNQAQVVSNSLPIWLSIPYSILAPGGLPFPAFPIYPAYALPTNLNPPYATVYIPPESTESLVASNRFDRNYSSFQLTKENARITLYGLRNTSAVDFKNYVVRFALEQQTMGVMNAPVPRDEHRTQRELGILAMKKVIDFEVNYYQTRLNAIARQLILSCIPTFIFGDE